MRRRAFKNAYEHVDMVVTVSMLPVREWVGF